MKKKLILYFFLFTAKVFIAQNDCVDAIVVCGNSNYNDLTATGIGTQELSGSNACSGQENNSLWLSLNINNGGTLAFTLTPTFSDGTHNPDINIDFDFFVFGPNVNCGNIGTAIRCSTTNPFAANQGNNYTGMNAMETDISEGPGTDGNSFVQQLNVNSGDSYFIVIDRPVGVSNFNITWAGTATFNDPPIINPPPSGLTYDLEQCDGDGTIDNSTLFDLTVNSDSMIGLQTNVIFAYFTSNNDAQTGTNRIANPTSFLNTSNPQTIYARIEDSATGCFTVSEFTITVLDGLNSFTPPKIKKCDDNNDGLFNFDLTENNTAIINGQDNLEVSYFETQNNAENNTSPILGLYTNTSNPQTVWVRLQSTLSECYRVENFTIEVFDQPTATQPPNMVQCDDDNNGTMPFMLTNNDALINTDAGMSVTYYLTQAEADAGTTGALTSPFESGSRTIYARVENVANTPCYDTTSFDIEVFETAFPSTNVTLLADCDNTSVGTDADGFIVFNLHDRETEIANTQNLADFTLTYFTDANYTMQIPVADETTFTNTFAGGQTIYVRMTNNVNSTCFTDTSFNIEVYPLPVLLTNTITLIQCNDDLTLIEPFNLRLKEDEISANAATETFTYYETLAEAEAGITSTQITNPTSYPNQIAGYDTVWARIQNADGCHRTAQVNLDVNPSSAVMNGFATMQFFQCDDGADNRDGIATFNFSSVTTTIQNIFAPLAVDVLYYETEAQANQGLTADQLDPTNYDNITQDQLIWVQIVSDFGSDCLAKGQYVQLHVEALPTANAPTTVMKQCDDDNDGFFAFNTSTITSEILNGQSLADVNITYFNQNGTPISGVVNSNLPDPFLTNSQTINIVVTNNATSDPDGACSDATTLTFIVDQLPINNVQPIPAICETDPDDGLLIATFDTSNLENSINAQAGMQITYLNSDGNPLQDIDGNTITSPFPNTFTTQSQTITVAVTNPLNPTCPSEVSLDFIVNPRPVFDDLEDQMVCENILPHLITVPNPDANNYNYEWYNSLGTIIGNNQTLPITNTTDITVTGVNYNVTVTNPTTNCSRTKTVHLKKSSIATLLDTDIVTIEFSSPNNSITINTNNLGIGDYEFALEHNSDARPYQDEPVFTELQGGVYTILINDKNDCGEISKIVFLLDYPKFLTPNNDGYNDVWQLIGLDSTTYIVSPIQIYDRYGKIVGIINPISGEGWNGFYNNKTLPSSDYWFVLTLTDAQGTSEIKKGHFSLIRR